MRSGIITANVAANKKTIDAILDVAGIGPTEKRLVRAENMSAAEFQASQTAKLQRIAAKLADRLEAEAGELPTTSLAINIGIISDKLRDLGAIAPPTVTNQTNIQINGMDRAALVQLLSGKRAPKAAQTDGPSGVGANGPRQNLPSGVAAFPISQPDPQNRQRTAPRPPRVEPVNAPLANP